MLRAVLVTLGLIAVGATALLTTSAAPERAPAASESAAIVYEEIQISSSLLPGPTGWFAVPIGVDRPAYVRVHAEYMDLSGDALGAAVAIMAIEGREAQPLLTTWRDEDRQLIEAAHVGYEPECCLGIRTSWSGGYGNGGVPILLQPGETLWIGLAAYSWDQGEVAFFSVSGQAILSQGEPRTGTRVEAIDLYAEAMRSGTYANALGRQVVAAAGDASARWTAEHHGLFMLQAWAEEGSGKLSVELPGYEPQTRDITRDGFYALMHREGTYAVTFAELDGPLVTERPWVSARAFFADVAIPADAAFIYP